MSRQAAVASPFICVEVKATDGSKTTAPLAWKDEGLVVAVFTGDGLGGEVAVTARGFDAETCEGLPSSESAAVSAAFPPSGFEVVTVQLVPFACTCADPRCEGQSCDDGNACTEGDLCAAGTCTGGTAKQCADQSECHTGSCDVVAGCQQTVKTDAACSAVPNGVCLPDGTCSDEESDCSNGLDDDGDLLVDCADPGCDLRSCRGAADVCDVAESCANGACPMDAFAQNTVICRAGAGDCDLPEACSGAAPSCPSDTLVPTGTSCRDAAGTCDVAEVCDGSMAQCPPDALAPPTTSCRPANGACDVAESCSGTSPTCGPDLFEPSTTSCRPQSDACDVAELCPGNAADCPPNAVQPPGTECRAPAGTCDVAEACDGATTACPGDAFVGASTECRAATAECDAPESCSGTSAMCGPDLNAPTGTMCSTGSCDSFGACVSAVAFPFYAPSNFDPSLYAASATTAYNITCAVVFDTSVGASNPGTWCGTPAPPSFDVPQSGGPNALVIPLQALTVASGGSLTFIGSRPVILAVYGSATIAGGIFADSTRTTPGAGATTTTCTIGLGKVGGASDTIQNNGGGGGGGGGFGAGGGSGGIGSGKAAGTAGSGAGLSSSEGPPELAPLRAGCSGGRGGTGATSGTNATPAALTVGGPGGGAVQLSVAEQLTITGVMSAGGAGGLAVASWNSGGGGGGSGGALLLEANQLDVRVGAMVAVNGGGGAQGAYQNKAAQSGGDGTSAGAGAGGDFTSNTQAGRGAGGGAGPNAGANGEGDRSNDSKFTGGGGGGGGAGRIRVAVGGAGATCTLSGTLSGQVSKSSGC